MMAAKMKRTTICHFGSRARVMLMRFHMRGPLALRSAELDARIHSEVDQVDRQVYKHREDRGKADKGLDRSVVGSHDGLDRILTKAAHVEDGFYQNVTTEKKHDDRADNHDCRPRRDPGGTSVDRARL